MDDVIIETAYAKINLTLDVFGTRSDGYHEVRMVMQGVSLADKILLAQAATIRVSTDMQGLPCDRRNLAYRAAELLRETYAPAAGASIRLEKHIPMAAGLAGGSSDAAAVLRGLNRLWQLELSDDELLRLGAELGSDVPFCLRSGTMLATGRGEVLSPLPPLPVSHIVLAKPSVAVSTAWVYQHYVPEAVAVHPDVEQMSRALAAGDRAAVAAAAANVLETVTIPAHPEVQALKERLLAAGAWTALMSGSGPTVFGIMPDARTAVRAAAELGSLPGVFSVAAETIGKMGD